MTEGEWLACTNSELMLAFLKGRASDRKLRLLTAACCRHFWHLIRDERSRRAVEAGESFADGRLDAKSLEVALEGAGKALVEVARLVRKSKRPERPSVQAIPLLVCARLPAWPTQSEQVMSAVLDSLRQLTNNDVTVLPPLIRDIFGNPFHPMSLDASFPIPGVVSLAQTVYDERQFDRMPELADALVAAGCTNADILAHCRERGPHVRGCWAVDLLLGKE